MKFGIITLVSDNYGNKYQNYAVEHLVKRYGEVTTYPLKELYFPQKVKCNKSVLNKLNFKYIEKVLRARMMYQFDYVSTDKSLLRSLLYVIKNKEKLTKLRERRRESFYKFSQKHLNISDIVLDYKNSSEQSWVCSVDYFLCGSDQIWNPSYSTTSGLAFCSFAPEKTIAIAPSFGVADIPQERKQEYASYLRNIYKLSVREDAGYDIIKNLSGRDAEVLLDPTMAIDVKEWEKLSKKPDVDLPGNYIVCYFLGKIDKTYRKMLNDFSKKLHLPLVMLFDITKESYYTLDPSEVLYTIEHADYVLTDSFHGTIFSILFHRNFYVFCRNEGGGSMNSRLETLLKKFGFTERVFTGHECEVSLDQWKETDLMLELERKRTEKFICSSIEKC